MSETTNIRKTRSDKGRTLITERDRAVLRWVGEMYGVSMDHLQILLGRDAQRETEFPGLVGHGTAKRVVERWKRAGLVHSQKYFYKKPSWVWLTRQGLQQFISPSRYWQPKMTMLDHFYWVNHVRLYIENRRGNEAIWRSERQLKLARTPGEKKHLVDAEIEIQGSVIGLEVELTPKKIGTTREIMEGLAKEYSTIWYFTNQQTRALITRCVADFSESVSRKFRVYDLEDTM
jgi:hypothetical protein